MTHDQLDGYAALLPGRRRPSALSAARCSPGWPFRI
jgi:hypothetical protein